MSNILHIGIFGCRNKGKSSLINYITKQHLSIVSEVSGTTTDPVKKRFEIPDVGKASIIDTAGIDDDGSLGEMRVEKTLKVISEVDVAILVISNNTIEPFDFEIVDKFEKYKVPFFVVHNKSDIEKLKVSTIEKFNVKVIDFNTIDADSDLIFSEIKEVMPSDFYKTPSLLGGIVNYGDVVLLITPIDSEAPTGRLILPQVQMIRDILDNDCVAIVLKEKEVDAFLKNTGIKPALVIVDSQIFLKADSMISDDIPLTSFSLVLAHFKGEFDYYIQGTPQIGKLKNRDRILLLESCSHQTSCDDIGRVKIPRWIRSFTGLELFFDVVAGLDKVERPITDYSLVIQCGGCMISNKQLKNRLAPAIDAKVPVTNYGMAIAYVQGIYNRAVAPFINIEDDYL